MTVLALVLPWPGESLISRAPALARRLVLAREFAGLPESFHLLKSRRERGEKRETFQSLNPPALQTSNRAERNQKALQHSGHGKRGTVKAALHMKLGAGARVGDEGLAFTPMVLVGAGADWGAGKPAAPRATLHWVAGDEAGSGWVCQACFTCGLGTGWPGLPGGNGLVC